MAEELPDLPVTSFKAEEGIVAQIYPLLADSNMHLHRHVLKVADKALPQVLQVVIAEYQIYLAVQPVKHLCPF